MIADIKVLDHGMVRLVEHVGSDLSVSRAARVSYDAPPREQDVKLIKYLWDNKHTSPFEAVVFTFEIKAPIFVLRQWMRHRTAAYNELSARYKKLPHEIYLPDLDQITTQSTDNKQMRTDTPHPEANQLREMMISAHEWSFEIYEKLLDKGCPRELARSVLPLGTYSHMFTTVNLRNLFNFLNQRTHEHSQYEIRVYADAMLELIRPIVPACVAAWEGK